jgi:hypothetical protein
MGRRIREVKDDCLERRLIASHAGIKCFHQSNIQSREGNDHRKQG